ncbi:hypothetical protein CHINAEXTREME_20445 (plasmid) [Halobiforma lacisalsi AJ5]|uniref:Uncharacterized protein n=1 Tax=Natronobacterium lacisalsi AJ5 TaxID=358396 RepID=M0LYH1_NATLA|nr:hypothetical protein [Halobiforma lacisalsi]APX00185.1 hypothetical protein CHINAEXTREME_20445 [Halobiforma lacisalsi AJ5]EMA37399.1 hypothetical protein C445_00881 [Halobiforma lacisalsi AJ5]
MIEPAIIFTIGSLWTLLILQIGYRQGYQKGQDDAELEVASIMLDREYESVRRERERLESE